MKVIFLDNDGVLNGYGYGTGVFMRIMHFPLMKPIWKLVSRKWRLFDIHKKYVRRLAKIVKETGAVIVSSSSWRGRWMIAGVPEYDIHDHHKFCQLFEKYDLHVYDITPSIKGNYKRSLEIQTWLDANSFRNIESFVILDDECMELREKFPNNIVCTSKTGLYEMISGSWYEGTGLKRKHVKEAIDILNTKSINDDSTNHQ